MDSLGKAGVIALKASTLPRWTEEAAAITEVLHQHHGEHAYQSIKPLRSAAMRSDLVNDLRRAAPGFGEFVDELARQFKQSCGVFVPELGLEWLDTNSRALVVYAIGVCLGEPTATDKSRVIWDVKARSTDSGYFSTFSETDLEAAYHSDTQYYPNPEDSFILYTIQAAVCGGGWSRICDARGLRSKLERTAPWVFRELSDRPLPFRVPTAFMTTEAPGAVQATIAPVFGKEPFIRYRRDTLEDGLQHFPVYGHADARRALEGFEDHLARCEYAAEFFMASDSLLLLDNHHALHARTSFQDQARHLLRIRLRSASSAMPACDFLTRYSRVQSSASV